MKTPLPQNASPIEIATLAHAGQFRRDGVTPYIEHPRTVASHFEHGTGLWAVAWMHDVLEDSDYLPADLLAAGVHPQVVEALVLLTHMKGESYKQYIENIKRHKDTAGSLALKVKIADIATNLGDDPTERQIKKYSDALSILISTV
jgi:(p)ppGpp synthase/HD superfamily hydrolase